MEPGSKNQTPPWPGPGQTTRLSDMEIFSAGFLIDAFDFFHEFEANLPQQPDDPRVWSNLKKLHLTSGRLNPHLASWKEAAGRPFQGRPRSRADAES